MSEIRKIDPTQFDNRRNQTKIRKIDPKQFDHRRKSSTNSTTTKPTRDRKFKSLRYPVARLESDSDYLEVKVLEYQAPGFEQSNSGQALRLQTSSESIKNNEIILGHIFLPIPEAITDSNGVTWGEDSLNGVAATALGVLGGAM